jgi:hypothetical protein
MRNAASLPYRGNVEVGYQFMYEGLEWTVTVPAYQEDRRFPIKFSALAFDTTGGYYKQYEFELQDEASNETT